MSALNLQQSIKLLQKRLEEIPRLRQQQYSSPEFNAWQNNLRRNISEIYGDNSVTFKNFLHITGHRFLKGFVTDASNQSYYFELLDQAKITLECMIEELNENFVQEINDEDSLIKQFKILNNIFSKFHAVSKQLLSRYNNRETLKINDEYDVQDLLHAILKLDFDDIRSEEWTPSYAGGSSRMDFLLKKEKIVIEVKKASKDLSDKRIKEQLIIDIHHYQVHPDCKHLVCFVYDPDGTMKNPSALINDLSKEYNGLPVHVIIVPK